MGWKVAFGTAIVPNWRDGRITLKDVTIDLGDVTIPDDLAPLYEDEVPLKDNYTRFSVQVDRLDVRISLRRWLEGRGWLEEVLIDGARGTLDKRWIRFVEGWRWKSRPDDFNLDFLQLRNVHLNIIQPRGYRPYSVTILSASVPRLRASWLFYDLLSAESAHGIFDGRSLFTLHNAAARDKDEDGRELKHFRMLGLDVRHLSQSCADNALGWVTRGTVDIEGFYQLPKTDQKQHNRLLLSNKQGPSFEETTLLEKLLTSGNKEEEFKGPLRFWYESKLRPNIPDEFVKLTDNLISLPERISDRISQSKHHVLCI